VNIAIVGAGQVGSVLGRILADRGERIVAVVSRTLRSARRAGRFLRCKTVSTSLAAIPPRTDLVFITTPHAAVEEVAHNLAAVAHLDFRRLVVCHASGMLTAAALEPLAKKGATVFSFHPLQTFPRDFLPKEIVPTAHNIYYGVDGTRRAIARARQLARKLHGKVIVIPPERRAVYHAACVVASNHLTTMLWVVEQMFKSLRTNERKFYPVFEPIIMATLRNVARTSPAQALSGPVARGGVETVAQHFEAIREHSQDLLPYFVALTEETTRLAEAKGSITQQQAQALYSLSESYRRS